jgi:hypothetical protein
MQYFYLRAKLGSRGLTYPTIKFRLIVVLIVENKKPLISYENQGFICVFGGEGGIRTHVRHSPKPDFESGAFDHSATSPDSVFYYPESSKAHEYSRCIFIRKDQINVSPIFYRSRTHHNVVINLLYHPENIQHLRSIVIGIYHHGSIRRKKHSHAGRPYCAGRRNGRG